MADTEGEIIIVFASNTRILNAEELLEEQNLPFVLVPVPKEVNPNCGLAISMKESNSKLILDVLRDKELLPSAAYRKTEEKFSNYNFD